jgi:hypothetical protein
VRGGATVCEQDQGRKQRQQCFHDALQRATKWQMWENEKRQKMSSTAGFHRGARLRLRQQSSFSTASGCSISSSVGAMVAVRKHLRWVNGQNENNSEGVVAGRFGRGGE